jgi:ribosomal protein S18 acetylase RimI-like enzyme
MGLRIRSADEADETAVIALWRACGLLVKYNNPATDFRFARAKENSDILLGDDTSERIIASVMVGHDGHRGWLYYVAVDPARRGQGFGRLIVQAGEKWLLERSIPKVQLMVRKSNIDVAAFYERIGFETVPNIVMQKWLRQISN